ncbi:MAG: aldolase [Methanomicrobiales archaeon]|nr:aldolase [Methanomicrobiales archaeon]
MCSSTAVNIPLDVPASNQEEYLRNYHRATHGSGRLMLFAGDQKVEHMNDDFYGTGIPSEDGDPEHLFRIASQGKIGLFATHLGLIARYGMEYRSVPYLVKLNGKTNLVGSEFRDPVSPQWHPVEQVMEFKKSSGLSILGVGYSLYPGSTFEADMLREAAQVVYQAHRNGLLTILWIYPRGRSVRNEQDPHLIAGAAGLGASLGTDFVKVNPPFLPGISSAEALKEAVQAAGKAKVLCAGGSATDPHLFLSTLYAQIHISGAGGNATGRNIHQKPLDDAIRMCNAIYAITVEDASLEEALSLLTVEK